MGRKSNAKKAAREQEKEKQSKKEGKGFFKSIFSGKKSEKARKKDEQPKKVEQPKKEKKTKQPRKKLIINKKKFFGWVFAIIMLAILISVGYLLFQKAFRAKPIAKILPDDRTVITFELNTNFEHNQLLKTFHLLTNQPQYSREKLIEWAEIKLNTNYEKDLKPWLGRQIGFAILNPKDHEDTLHTVYFIEYLSKGKAENFLNRYKGTFYSAFIDDYIFLSSNEKAISDLIDDQKSEELYAGSKYREIDNNLPLNKLAYLYIDFEKITDSFFQTYPFLSEKGFSLDVLKPFLNLFDAEGVAFIALDDNFAIQSFLSLNEEVVDKIDYIGYQEKYTADLADAIPQDVLAFWGGENLEAQIKRLIELLAGGDQANLMVFDSLLQNYTKKYFGADVNFRTDILPLFHNEFAFVIEKSEDKNIYKILIELSSPQKDALNIQEIANSFAKVGAIFEPKIVEHTLEDGTVGKEIVAVPEEIIKSSSQYQGDTINELIMGEQGWGIYYAMLDDMAVIATDREGVKNTIDIAKGEKPSLKSTELFTKHIEPVLKSSDEVSYFNLEGFLPLLLSEENLAKYPAFGIVASLSSGRNYFNDGVVTINYLQIK